MTLEIEMATCSYGEYRPEYGVPIRASRGEPKWFRYQFAAYWESITPTWPRLKMPYDVYRGVYLDRLDQIGVDQLMAERDAIVDQVAYMFPGNERISLVSLCYEGLRKPGNWCHRTMFGEWWCENTGEDVIEYGACPPPPELRREPPLSLF